VSSLAAAGNAAVFNQSKQKDNLSIEKMYPRGLLQASDVCTLILHSFEKRILLKSNLYVSNFTIKYLNTSVFLNQKRKEGHD
jgi:hypothetical protein